MNAPANAARSGVLFSILALVLAGLIVTVFWVVTSPSYVRSVRTAQVRVGNMDDFMRSWESYVESATATSVRESLWAITARRSMSGPGVDQLVGVMTADELVGRVSDCLMNASYTDSAGNQQPCICPSPPCPANQRVRGLSAELSNFTFLAKQDLNINTTWQLIGGITMEDYGPFQLRVAFTLNYSVSDPVFASWNRTHNFEVIVPVHRLPDPLWQLYGAATAADPQRIIQEYPVPRPVVSRANVTAMITGRLYAAQPGAAPTYLDRLGGDLDPSSWDARHNAGIELLTSPSDYLPGIYGGSADERNASFVDHSMFRMAETGVWARCGIDTFGIKDFPIASWRLDATRLARYNFDMARDYNFTCT